MPSPKLVPLIVFAAGLFPCRMSAQAPPALEGVLDRHRPSLEALALLDGDWQGSGWTLTGTGEKQTFQQVIQVRSADEDTLKMLQGTSFDETGHQLGTTVEVFSVDDSTGAYLLTLYTGGQAVVVPIHPEGGGFTLEFPEGAATIRSTVTVTAAAWHEVMERRPANGPAVRLLETTLSRVPAIRWPPHQD